MRTTDHHCDVLVGVEDEVRVLRADTHSAASEPYPQLERRLRGGKNGVHMERPRFGTEPGEPEGEGLPKTAHGGEMQAGGS